MRFDIDPDDESPEARLCRIINVFADLPDDLKPHDDTQLRDVLGGRVTYGDLVALAKKHFKQW